MLFVLPGLGYHILLAHFKPQTHRTTIMAVKNGRDPGRAVITDTAIPRDMSVNEVQVNSATYSVRVCVMTSKRMKALFPDGARPLVPIES